MRLKAEKTGLVSASVGIVVCEILFLSERGEKVRHLKSALTDQLELGV